MLFRLKNNKIKQSAYIQKLYPAEQIAKNRKSKIE